MFKQVFLSLTLLLGRSLSHYFPAINEESTHANQTHVLDLPKDLLNQIAQMVATTGTLDDLKCFLLTCRAFYNYQQNPIIAQMLKNDGNPLSFTAIDLREMQWLKWWLKNGNIAAFPNKINITKLLLEHNADVNAKDNDGNTSLDLAKIFFKNSELITLLENAAAKFESK